MEGGQEGLQIGGAFAFGDIEDPVPFEVAEGGRESATFVQGMLVDTEDLGAVERDAFAGFAAGELLVDALDAGGAETGDGGES